MKKRFYFIIVLALIGGAAFNSRAGYIVLNTPPNTQITSMSSNGRYVCGIDVDLQLGSSGNRGFIWDLYKNEFKWLSEADEISNAFGVSDNGIVAGQFYTGEVTANGAKVVSGGYWKEGKWYALETVDNIPIAYPDRGSRPMAISDDGQYITGSAYSQDKYFVMPVLWKNGFVEKVYKGLQDNQYSVAYDVSNDGSMVCGWADVDDERTVCLWTPEPTRLCEDKFIYHAAQKFSYNNKYVACTSDDIFLYDIERKYTTIIPLVNEQASQFYANWVCDDKTILWTEDGQAAIHNDEIGTMLLKNYLSEYENVPGINMMQCMGISKDGRIFAGNNGSYNGCILLLDQDTDKPAPVYVAAEQIKGTSTVTLTITAPLTKGNLVKGYNVFRNGEKINTTPIKGNVFLDKTAGIGVTYSYQATAIYDAAESSKSRETAFTVSNPFAMCEAPVSLAGRQTGYNDVLLQWIKPIVSDGVLKWNKGPAVGKFGSNNEGSYYYGVKFTKSMLSCYDDSMLLSGIEITPMAAPADLEIILKVGDKELYNAPITRNLIIGQPNEVSIAGVTIGSVLDEMSGDDDVLFLIIKVTQEGGVFVSGIDPTASDKGLGDLVSQTGDDWQSVADLTGGIVSGNWCLGLLVNNEMMGKNLIGYNIYRDNVKVKTVTNNINKDRYEFIDMNLNGNEYKYVVEGVYKAGNEEIVSPKSNDITVKMKNKQEPCTPPSDVNAYRHGTEEINDIEVVWSSPNTEQQYNLGYTDWNYKKSLEYTGGEGRTFFSSIVIDKSEMRLYEGFKITQFSFYPVGDANKFVLHIYENEIEIYSQELSKVNLNKKNTIDLTKSLDINMDADLRIAIELRGMKGNKTIGIDGSINFVDYGDLYSSDGLNWGSIYAANSVVGNWMMDITLSDSDSKNIAGNNLVYYNVYMNDVKMTQTPVSSNTYTIKGNTLGTKYPISVSAVYTECDEQFSDGVQIQIGNGIEDLNETIAVYPNPASDFVNIDGDVISVSIYDVAGKLISNCELQNSNNGVIVNVAQLKAGIYMFNIETAEGSVTKRIAIKK